MEQSEVKIIDWPKGDLNLSHEFPNPVHLEMNNSEKTPLFVNMNMVLPQDQKVPLCIKLCDPLCAESNYRIGINLMGQPFAEIVIKGMTRLFNLKAMNDAVPVPE